MVDAISTYTPVANVAIPAAPITPSQNVGSPAPSSSPSVDQVSISPEAQIAARQVYSERPDISASQAQSVQLSDASDAVIENAGNLSSEPESVTVPPPDTNAVAENTDTQQSEGKSSPLADLVEL